MKASKRRVSPPIVTPPYTPDDYGWVVKVIPHLFVAYVVSWEWDPLDNRAYLVCLGFGLGFSVAVFGVSKAFALKGRLARALVLASIWGPSLAIFVGIGCNVLLDSSPAVRHETTFLECPHNGKGGTPRALFASWRRPGDKEALRCTEARTFLCAQLTDGQRVEVVTHEGAFGWEWIADVIH
ncbi:MAG: hypothetical protein JWM82_1873 [Myxococcales bacterium]|nr:hypothetical protein [Myxococcales bacterium]